ncbi:16S rRNA (uracil(1498)-N(3))-methyltransferase [Gilvimarinus xylanilyticus]|uniref:Ribosomal RNA small subunit methyltransferase E n=1 Tax=Gilvimarinus xylanilyticus TaxID=2944139 RepID=A0A9X2KSB0_9GAMM|nr:16S rRNA (uracil(1498)-N(3))-methyltransferase [Gilvimarinus xylanilyticus]MCP8898646.1 16S rRNA (uracil(1498)-N(3))-methyltransferase [Gilvimarinus xylanilyticus]
MNLILLFPQDFSNSSQVLLADPRRVEHITRIHKAVAGDSLKVGLANGDVGRGVITQISAGQVSMRVELDTPPPEASNIRVILGLPRPPMLKRSLQNLAALGVKDIVLLQSARVEKSYWQSPQLTAAKIQHELVLGLEQSCDTQLPQVRFAKRFRPFMEDELNTYAGTDDKLIAHPYSQTSCPYNQKDPLVLAIGPEGGFLDKELDSFCDRGFVGVTLGSRILRVETALPYLLGRLGAT